jgi:hypothetical protein
MSKMETELLMRLKLLIDTDDPMQVKSSTETE